MEVDHDTEQAVHDVRLIDGNFTPSDSPRIIGFCHNSMHRGLLTVQLMKSHECITKECHYFEKYETSPYWLNCERSKKRIAAKKEAAKRRKEKALRREASVKETETALILRANEIAAELGFDDLRITGIHRIDCGYTIFYISRSPYNDWYQFRELAFAMCREYHAKFTLKHAKLPDGQFAVIPPNRRDIFLSGGDHRLYDHEKESAMLTIEQTFLHPNLTSTPDNHLAFAGLDTVALAAKYGTPLMLLDEDLIRSRIRLYTSAMRSAFGADSGPLYASKALSFKGIYRIAAEEGMRIDIVSPGELYTAVEAGFPVERAFFHGNNKTDADIAYALDCGIGYFVADNREELDSLDRLAAERGITQKILLRLTPGIDPHTHAKINTGRVDSKFGTSIETGQADDLVRYALSLGSLDLVGFHCHVGSQIFDIAPFTDAADIMIAYAAHIRDLFGFEAQILNLGGGFGVRYTADDPVIDYAQNIADIADHISRRKAEHGIGELTILMEPGRSLVADAGLTVYTVGSVKDITGYRSYVSIDGGMTDNPRYTLYQSRYTILNADRVNDTPDYTCTVAGRCCESGDLIAEEVTIPRPVRGEHIAVCVTGAYNYAMASNYNRIPRPAVVLIADGKDTLAIRRETYADLCRNDI